MKKLFVVLMLLVSFGVMSSGCQSVGCTVENVASAALAPAVALGLQCSNTAAIQATLVSLGNQAGLCTAPQPTGQQASAGNAICTTISGLVLDQVAANGIPASWGCTAANAKALIQGVVNQACAKL